MMSASVQIGVRQQREKPRALDRDRQLALVARLGAGDTRRNQFAVFVDEDLQDVDVLVIDFFYFLSGETAEFSATKQWIAARAAILAFVLAEFAFTQRCSSWHDVFL